MKNAITIIGLVLILSVFSMNLFAEDNSEKFDKDKREKVLEKLSKLPKDSLMRLNSKTKKPNLNHILNNKELLKYKKVESDNKKSSIMQLEVLPDNIKVPAEFDELQAVLISWPCYAFDKNYEVLEPLLPGIGVKYISETEYELVEIAGYVADLFAESDWPPIWGKLADAIQKEAEVWIRLSAIDDSTSIKNYMAQNFSPLTNYKFIHDPNGENAFWMRDFGPYGFYWGDKDSIGFISMGYYPGRPIDDSFPEFLANKLGYPYFESEIESEGGNFMTDGWGNGFYSTVIYYSNADTLGQIYMEDGEVIMKIKEPMSPQQLNSGMQKLFNLKSNNQLDHLYCDGGTGHIDIYLKLVDDNTMLINNYPSVYNNMNFIDYTIVKQNKALLNTKKNSYGKPYQILEVPLPTSNNGKYTRTNCESFNADARTFLNGITVNKTFIIPGFSNSISGNAAGDAEAIETIKKYMPGYNVVAIDSRSLSPLGGAIHCITMQIPAENPLTIAHAPVVGALNNIYTAMLNAEIYNHSGIKNANIMWRYAGANEWNTLSMENVGNQYNANLSFSGLDEEAKIEYFIEAESNNGKTRRKPVTAPEGFYSFSFPTTSSVEFSSDTDKGDIRTYPNVISDYTSINYNVKSAGNVSISIFDNYGSLVKTVVSTDMNAGVYSLDFNATSLTPGMYYCRMNNSGKISIARFIVVR